MNTGLQSKSRQSASDYLAAKAPLATPLSTDALTAPKGTDSEKELKNLEYLTAHIDLPIYAQARRQGFKRVLAYAHELGKAGVAAMQEADAHKAMAGLLWGSATGRFAPEQIQGHAGLTEKQKADCLLLIQQREDAEKYRGLCK